MTRQEFNAKMDELMGPGAPYGGNGEPGFTLVHGTSWTRGTVIVRAFHQTFPFNRRLRPENVVTVTVNGRRIQDSLVTEKTLLRAYDYAKYNLNPVPA
jgi:hypothetical protein